MKRINTMISSLLLASTCSFSLAAATWSDQHVQMNALLQQRIEQSLKQTLQSRDTQAEQTRSARAFTADTVVAKARAADGRASSPMISGGNLQ